MNFELLPKASLKIPMGLWENLKLIYKYFCYQVTAGHKKGHGLHSPFVYDLVSGVFRDKKNYDAFIDIEELRRRLSVSDKKIHVQDPGAGSGKFRSKERMVKDIARYSSVNKKYGRLLFRLVNYFKPKIILELGTSLGISSLYMAMAEKNTVVHTIEGCPETAKIAERNFKDLNMKNIVLYNGNFDDILQGTLEKTGHPDLVFIDGNHRKQPTLRYFDQCMKASSENTIFVFDDIHRSREMEEAWREIKSSGEVTVTIDIFFMGIVFFRKELSKQDFVIKY